MKTKKLNKKTSEEKAHALFSASGSERWLNCEGSIELSKGLPDEEGSEASKEGTVAHSCLEFICKNRKNPEAARKMALKTWSQEMVDHALTALDYVNSILKKYPDAQIFIETRVDASKFTMPGQFGTLDICIVIPSIKKIFIIDYKYGVGLLVDPKDNSQLIYYGLGMLLKLGWNKFKTCELVILQPRREDDQGQTVRSWVTTSDVLLAWGTKFKTGVKKALRPNAPLKYGEKHCFFCPARHKCPELKEKGFKEAMIDFDDSKQMVTKTPDITKIKNMGNLLLACDKLEMFIKAVREKAYNDAKRGVMVDGFKLVEKKTTRKWTDENKVKRLAIKAVGNACLTEPKLLSPAQFEKKVKGKNAKTFVQKNTTNKASGVTLVPMSDKRKPVNIFEVDFTEIEED